MKRYLVPLLVLSLLLAGCASTGDDKVVFRLGMDATAATKKLMWPPEKSGEIPRYFYVGELTGENNFVKPPLPPDVTKSFLTKFLDLIIGEAPPLLLDRPQAGTVDEQGRILVTDMGHAGVFVFDEKNAKLSLWTVAHGATNFIGPVGVAVGPEGRVFVADAELGLIAQLDRDGKTLPPIGLGQLKRPTGLAYDPSLQRLFVTDTLDHQVKVFDLDGNLLSTIGGHGENDGQFNYPTHVAIGDQKLVVSDTLNARVQVFATPTGHYLGTIGRRGLKLGNMVRPKGVAIDNEHNIYVIESYHDYMLVYNRRGEFLLPIGGIGEGPGNFHLPAGIWVDGRNRVYVADMLNARVSVFQFLGGDSENAE